MTHRPAPRSSHRLVGVVSAFSLVASLAAAVAVTTSMADGVAPVPRMSLGPNLIDNSGFGSGLRSWSRAKDIAGSLGITRPGVWGSVHAARLQSNQPRDGYLRDERDTAPRVQAGAVYQASAWVRATGAPVSGELRLLEWSGDNVANLTQVDFKVSRADWQRVTLIAPATTSTGRLQVAVVAHDISSDKGVKVDRVRLHPIKGASATSTPTTALPDTTEPDGDETVTPTPSNTETSPTTEPTKTSSPTPTKTSTPTPTNTETAPDSPSGTLFGASVYEAGRTWTEAVADSNEFYGGMDVVRVFYPGLPSAWPGRAGQVNGPVVVSFKAQPSEVLSGKYDAFFTDWFKKAPRDRDIWWTYWHEPEDDVESGGFKAEEWRNAYRRLAGFADAASNPKLHNTVILMCWTVNPKSGRTFSNYFPGSDVVETLGWDCYSHPSDPTTYSRPEDMYGRAVTQSKALGIPFGIAETGSRLAQGDESGEKRAVWLRTIARWLADRDATFVTYFDSVVGGEFRLLDEPSRKAWRDVVTSF
jgi:hypothetical protein